LIAEAGKSKRVLAPQSLPIRRAQHGFEMLAIIFDLIACNLLISAKSCVTDSQVVVAHPPGHRRLVNVAKRRHAYRVIAYPTSAESVLYLHSSPIRAARVIVAARFALGI